MDVLGPFPVASGQRKFILVAIDYFTKWIEAEAVAAATAERVKRFLWQNIVCRHGVPNALVTDNGTQFASSQTARFCQEIGIRQIFASVEHPQTNGQAEAANKIILNGIKKRLDDAKGAWPEELPAVLWSYHTTIQSATRETPFRLTYGHDAMIPIEIWEPSLRSNISNLQENNEGLLAELDTTEEIRENAYIRQQAANRRAAKRYNSNLNPRELEVGDLVLRRADGPRKEGKHGKLAATWEGPYRVRDKVGKGAYRLERLNGTHLGNTWNISHLKRYY